jgi:P-type Ca2+ transporter type 2C
VWVHVDSNPGVARIAAKGALEGVLEHCRSTADERERVLAANADLASRGMRVLAVAGRFSPAVSRLQQASKLPDDGDTVAATGFSGLREEDERDLELYGLLAFQDPLRAEVPDAVTECQSAGIRLKLITGDHALTAHAAAQAAGIFHRDDLIFTGPQLAQMNKERFEQAVGEASIFARVSPDQKYAIVDALVRAGEVVAMTGDGINDAPALRRAHIGVAMGQRGTEAARAAASLVLLRDDFSALVATVREGRRIYSNIQRAFRYLIGFKFMLVGLALLPPLTGLPLLLLPIDLVWLELIVHPVSALAFEGYPGTADLMLRPPRDPAAPIITPGAALRPAISGALLTATAFVLFVIRLAINEEYARAVAIALVIVGSLLLVGVEFAADLPLGRVGFPHFWRPWIVGLGALASIAAAMWIPGIAALVRIAPISIKDWGLVAVLAIASVIWRIRANLRPQPGSRRPNGSSK